MTFGVNFVPFLFCSPFKDETQFLRPLGFFYDSQEPNTCIVVYIVRFGMTTYLRRIWIIMIHLSPTKNFGVPGIPRAIFGSRKYSTQNSFRSISVPHNQSIISMKKNSKPWSTNETRTSPSGPEENRWCCLSIQRKRRKTTSQYQIQPDHNRRSEIFKKSLQSKETMATIPDTIDDETLNSGAEGWDLLKEWIIYCFGHAILVLRKWTSLFIWKEIVD